MNRLRTALDELAVGGPDFAERLAAFQAQLLNSEAQLIVIVQPDGSISPAGLDPATKALVVAAARDDIAIEGRGVASAVGAADGGVQIALHRMTHETPLAQALARERLELVRALGRANTGQQHPEIDARLLDFAATPWTAPALHALAVAMASEIGTPRLAFAMLKARRVVQVADSIAAALAPEARRSLALAAGEVADSGAAVATAGSSGFTGFDRLADGAEVRAVAALSPAGNGMVTFLWASADIAGAVAFTASAAPIAVARLTRPSLAHSFDRLVQALPWPDAVAPPVRPRIARRILIGLGLAILLLPVPDRVGAPMSIEPLVRRVVTAPATARIEAVAAEPGDQVVAGALLVRFDAAQPQRERDEAEAALQAAATQAASARADGNVDAERLAQLKAAQLASQLTMLEGRLAEAEVRAPIAGTVNGEDLRRRVGATVSRGETLFSIAAPGGYRAELLVGDSDVSRLAIGARVVIRLSAEPLNRRSGRITRIYPLAEVVEGRNIFRTLVAIDADDADGLRAGMGGSAAVTAAWTPLAWQAVRPAIHWVRAQLWL